MIWLHSSALKPALSAEDITKNLRQSISSLTASSKKKRRSSIFSSITLSAKMMLESSSVSTRRSPSKVRRPQSAATLPLQMKSGARRTSKVWATPWRWSRIGCLNTSCLKPTPTSTRKCPTSTTTTCGSYPRGFQDTNEACLKADNVLCLYYKTKMMTYFTD